MNKHKYFTGFAGLAKAFTKFLEKAIQLEKVEMEKKGKSKQNIKSLSDVWKACLESYLVRHKLGVGLDLDGLVFYYDTENNINKNKG